MNKVVDVTNVHLHQYNFIAVMSINVHLTLYNAYLYKSDGMHVNELDGTDLVQ